MTGRELFTSGDAVGGLRGVVGGVFITLCVGVIVSPSSSPAAESRPPNIVFVLADDLGVGNVGCYGADRHRTPLIDALAAGGMRFTRASTAPLCGPSRACLMTGPFAFRTGATNQDATGRMRPADEPMIPAHLAAAGYVSACVGKWG
jgi:arylsulfatase A